MSVRITWRPSPESDIGSYDLQHGTMVGGPFTLLVNIPHNLTGPNYDVADAVFFYSDSSGTSAEYYRLIAIDVAGNQSAPSTPFLPTPSPPSITNTVKVDHNYGTPGALRYQSTGGIPIEAAVIRVYKKTDFDLGRTDAPLAVGMTDANGNWVNPIYLTTGFTYTIQFAKESLYGPDQTEIIV